VAAQLAQNTEAGAFEYMPAPQLTHWVPPVVDLYVPTLQFEQASAPAAE